MPLNGPDESNIKQVRSFSFGHSTEDARLNKIGSFQVAAIYLIELNGSERHLIVIRCARKTSLQASGLTLQQTIFRVRITLQATL